MVLRPIRARLLFELFFKFKFSPNPFLKLTPNKENDISVVYCQSDIERGNIAYEETKSEESWAC